MSIDDEDLTIFKGSIRSVPGSWARLSIDGDRISGIVWDGNELLLIDRVDRLEGLQAANGERGQTAVVRLVDIVLPIDKTVHSPVSKELKSAQEFMQESAALAQQYAAGEVVTPAAISLGVVIGTSLANSISHEVQAAIEWANIADGIFTEQVGIHLDLEHILNLYGLTDPFTSTDPGELLSTLADFKSSNSDLAPLGLTHLLTRNDLDGEVRGIAYLSSACGPSAGVSLTEARGSTIDALIMTHEIAHNLGAPHDAESGSACAATPEGFLMAPTLNRSSTFSDCSLSQISAFLDSVTCLAALPNSEIRLETPVLPAQVHYKEQIRLDVNIHNIGLESVLDSELDISGNGAIDTRLWSASDRDCYNRIWGPDQTCDLNNLYAGETVTVDFEFSPQATGQQVLDLVVNAMNDTDPSNNVATFVIDVLPGTEATVDGTNLTSIHTAQGGSVTYSLVISNTGDYDTPAVVRFQSAPGHTISSTANCTSPGSGQLDCDVGSVVAGGSATFEFEVVADPNLGLGLADMQIEYVDAILDTAVFNTAQFPDRQFSFVVWGAVYEVDAGFTDPPVSVDEGESHEFIAYVTNLGPDPVADLNLHATVASGIELGLPTADRGTCTVDGQLVTCSLGQFNPGERVEMRVPYKGVTPGNYTLELFPEFGGGHLTNQWFPNAFARFDVVSTAPPPSPAPPPPSPPTAPPTEYGGGGNTSLLWILALVSIALRRSSERPK